MSQLRTIEIFWSGLVGLVTSEGPNPSETCSRRSTRRVETFCENFWGFPNTKQQNIEASAVTETSLGSQLSASVRQVIMSSFCSETPF